jgi:predicted ester cyclase
MLRRQQAGDESFLHELVAADLVNHAAGPQGRSGLASILRTIDHDLGPVSLEQHHLIGDGDVVAQHLTLHGTHRASTMPLLAGVPPSGRRVAWRGRSSTSGASPTGCSSSTGRAATTWA